MLFDQKINYREAYQWKKMLQKVAIEESIVACLELQRGQENLHKNEKKYIKNEICNVGCKKKHRNITEENGNA